MIYDVSLNFDGNAVKAFSDGKMVGIEITQFSDNGNAALHLTKEEFYKLIRAFMFLDNETDKEEDDE